MDNPQVTLTELAWLAGIWDGEGTFGINRLKRKNEKSYAYHGRLTLSNTSEEMICEIERIFGLLGVKAHFWREKTSRKPTHKKAVHITLNKQDHVRYVCEKIQPYIVAKKERVSILLEYVISRQQYKKIAIRGEKGRILGVKTQGYSKKEISLYEQMKSLNQVGISV